MTDNLAIWNKLGKTDPAQTKAFKRGGGFTGTAIKPIYTTQKMTEMFGPVGVGWGFTEPQFQVVPGDNREVLVFCWLSLWILQDGKQSAAIPGVGGDKVVTHIKANEQYKRPERWENDDEAFKKAFTDAIGNAMKHLGMSADVHMGLFDDSKYVSAVRQEIADEKRAEAAPAKIAAVPEEPAQTADPKAVALWLKEVTACSVPEDLERLKRTPEFKAAWISMSSPTREKIQTIFSTARATFLSRQAA